MCGRYLIITTPEAMRAFFRYLEQPNFPPRYNVAPTQPIPVVRLWEGARHFALARWGLIPGWVKDPRGFSLLINARSESLEAKPAFRAALRYRRCLFPADGFYDWRREGERARPYYVRLKAGGPEEADDYMDLADSALKNALSRREADVAAGVAGADTLTVSQNIIDDASREPHSIGGPQARTMAKDPWHDVTGTRITEQNAAPVGPGDFDGQVEDSFQQRFDRV